MRDNDKKNEQDELKNKQEESKNNVQNENDQNKEEEIKKEKIENEDSGKSDENNENDFEKKDEEPNFDDFKLKFESDNSTKFNPKNIILLVLLIIIGFVVVNYYDKGMQQKEELTYSQFVEKLKQGEIKAVEEKGTYLFVYPVSDPTTYFKVRMISNRLGHDAELLKELQTHNVEIKSIEPERASILVQLLISSAPILILLFIWFLMFRNMQKDSGGGATQIFSMGKSKTKTGENQVKVTFDDVAGVVEAKEELKEVVEFLREPEKFLQIGARIPKGVLLLGSPGTGKTLLAKAVAGEAKVPFFSISGSEFVEMFVGVGASRVRDLFAKARKSSPCIVFIDEIDAVGRKRGTGHGGGNDEREQTLNQLLVEMDGFGTDENIIIVAATNRPDVLDKALLRPGRFDRQIVVDPPDINGREEILKVHIKNKKLGKNIDLKTIAKKTSGFVGADLSNLLNEAAILAARHGRKEILMEDMEEAAEKVMMGPERRSRIMPEKEKINTAYHEVGHALVAYLQPGTDPVHKVTIIPRGMSLGSTWQLPQEDKYGKTKKELLREIRVLLGGRAAEEIKFDDITTGAYNDIQRATHIAYQMVTSHGMSDIIGPLNLGKIEDGSLTGYTNYGPETAKKIDIEVQRIINDGYADTKKMLRENEDIFEAVTKVLLERETISGEEMEAIIRATRLEKIITVDKDV